MKILINTPQLSYKGGVGSYYLSLKKYWNENVRYHTSGSRRIFKKSIKIPGLVFLPTDIIKFLLNIIFWSPDVIVLNPSFIKNSLIREIIFLNVARFFPSKRICVFFRGWNKEYENIVNKVSLSKQLNKAYILIVLSVEFKEKLLEWGVKRPIEIATTKVDDCLLKKFNIKEKKFNNKILFLSTIKKEKGVFLALEVMKKFNKTQLNVELNIAGTGPHLENVQNYIRKNKLKNVNYLGHISGGTLAKVLMDNSIFIFPSFHGEGMPNSVLEAMAFGLPIVTRPVGGIKDFFENGKMGFIVNGEDPQEFYFYIEKLILNPNLLKEIGTYNHHYAKDNFLASKVALNFEKILKK